MKSSSKSRASQVQNLADRVVTNCRFHFGVQRLEMFFEDGSELSAHVNINYKIIFHHFGVEANVLSPTRVVPHSGC